MSSSSQPQPPKKFCSTESESIAREYVDNWSYIISLLDTTAERDVLSLLALLENVRVKWQKSEAETKYYKDKLTTAEKNNNDLRAENKALNDRLLNCEVQLSHVSQSKNCVEEELEKLKGQWEKLRSIIKNSNDGFMSDGLMALISNVGKDVTTISQYRNEDTDEVSTFESYPQSEIDYDKTSEMESTVEDFLPGPSRRRISRKRPSNTPQIPSRAALVQFEDEEDSETVPTKRPRNLKDIEITATIRLDSTGTRNPEGSVRIRRSRSESDVRKVEQEIIQVKPRPLTPHYNAGSTFSLKTPLGFAGSWSHGRNIEQREHRGDLISFPISFSCDVCNKRFGFTRNAYECRDCNFRFHDKCQSRAPLPCIPKVKMPKTPSKKKNYLIDYCPTSHPFIPPILVHCIIALERDHIRQEGIYRITCVPSAAKELHRQFLSASCRIAPDLSDTPMEHITGCIKKFLKELRDPVIPATSYNDFLQAIETKDEQKIAQCIFDLPGPHRDTLAYLILHLQKVAKYSSKNQMPLENLATVLAPTIIGYSVLVQNETIENAYKINSNQYMILLRLLKISSEFWYRFLENNMGAVLAAEARTPGSKAALLTVTPTTATKITEQSTTATTSSSGNRTPKMPKPRKPKVNNNQVRGAAATEISSPLFAPLSGASKNMPGITFKSAF